MAGLLAAESFPDCEIWQNTKKDEVPIHNALLRFRSPEIGERLGIPFKKVRVNKNIIDYDSDELKFSRAHEHQNYFKLKSTVNIRDANMYSNKVSGGVYNRSIWNIAPCDRWIAPENFHNILLERFKDRIRYETTLTKETLFSNQNRIVNTAPLPLIASWFPDDAICKEIFDRRPIYTYKFKINHACDVYQTVYDPHPSNPIYRYSITKDILIVETIMPVERHMLEVYVQNYIDLIFGIPARNGIVTEIPSMHKGNANGKLSLINDAVRKDFLHRLSRDHNVYSLGRFATWRNLLMDDLPKDINFIKLLMNRGSDYDAMINAFKLI